MKHLAFLAVLLLWLPLVEAEGSDLAVSFSFPAELGGQIWSSGEGSISMVSESPSEIKFQGKEIQWWKSHSADSNGADGYILAQDGFTQPNWIEQGTPSDGYGTLTASNAWGIRVAGEMLTWNAEETTLRQIAEPSEIRADVPHRYSPYPRVSSGPSWEGRSVLSLAENVTSLTLEGDFTIEVFAFSGELHREQTEEVRSGYDRTIHSPTGDQAWAFSHARIQVHSGTLAVGANQARLAQLSPSFDLRVNGTAHLPLTKGSIPGATQSTDGTWHIDGDMSFQGIQPTDSRQASATMDTHGATIHIDGQPATRVVKPFTVAATVGILATLAAAVKALPTFTALLTRLPPGKALENENRRKLYAFITAHPGATFREVLRGTEMAAGTARHHLTVLARSKMIVEHGHRSTLRFFENHGKFDATWTSVVLLREEDLAKVYDWISRHPDAIQRELLEHAESSWSWSRSTTQHRLARLIDGGLVAVQQAGRRKFYRTVAPESAEPAFSKASWT